MAIAEISDAWNLSGSECSNVVTEAKASKLKFANFTANDCKERRFKGGVMR